MTAAEAARFGDLLVVAVPVGRYADLPLAGLVGTTIPVSGDDPAAKRRVFDLVEQLGFEPVDAGGLADGGRRHQPGSAVYGADLTGPQLRERLVAAAVAG